MDTVVQWNIRGFRSNFEELKLLLNRLQSAVVALQKCRLGEGLVPPRGYTLLLPQGGSPGGEAALLIRNGTRFSEIDLKTGLHAAAATISLKKTLTVCSLYLLPIPRFRNFLWLSSLSSFRSPFSCWETFNAHSPAWGDSRRDGRGRMLEEFIAENDFIILNSGEQTFVHSASNNYSKNYQLTKQRAEKQNSNFSSENNEPYNNPFLMTELKNSIVKSNESAAGPDGVYYQFLRHLPESCLHTLLKLFNNIWTTGDIPPSWREASVVPIPKPGKDPSDHSNYRPIALTSCLCKTIEWMVNDRLVHVLESRNLLSNVQYGFRKDHSTLDHLVRLETFIKKAFARKKQVLAVFFDLEKAYDTTWRYGILKDLFDLDFRGRLPIFISNFLKDRHFKVKAENTFSSSYHQENGVPQDSRSRRPPVSISTDKEFKLSPPFIWTVS
ncbi:RNA-directed DNA polymerase from mobile element jockey [Plakobranchus ocellatus]|uniref:RNA-directed DNA polymerase from mobile element jockey n=1 Tax=Plakobranchus ocellatus TaxID=259542 RepID=A0AAV3ZXY0_9GAST|nr:RNA-directed DNA polymerase from mobile element jockey [Plakobranchus ocellatus]